MSEQTASAGGPQPPRNPPRGTGDQVSWWGSFRGWPRWARVTTYLSLGMVLVLVAGLLAGVWLHRKPLPQTTGEVELPGLTGEVEVIRDEYGIPQLYADTDADLMRAQGYVHAQERFYEMDIRRHVTAGRLSELFGSDGLETDKMIRTMGWRRVAEQELGLVSTETRAALEAYADGVNAYLDERGTTDIAVEYTLLAASGVDYTPEPWTVVDSLAWLKAMAWDLRGNMTDEITRAVTALDHDEEAIAAFFPDYDVARHTPIVTKGAVVDGVFEQNATRNTTRNPRRVAYPDEVLDVLEELQADLAQLPPLLGRGEGLGSNSWVVAGERSATGQPLLANDPHLGVSLPGIWMQMGLHCRELNADCTLDVSGYTFSGVPGVVIGHNADIAWGFTNLGPDVTDLYLEKVEGDSWTHDGETLPMAVRTEVIKVRDEDDFVLRVRETAHGPLVSDVSAEISSVGANAVPESSGTTEPDEAYAVSLAWTALQPQPTADAILQLNRASDWDEFRAAASQFAVPAQNLVYADREGHIGYQAPGLVPIRKSGNDGLMPAEGWLAENDWTGEYIGFDALPSVLDPDEGFIVTANQAVIGPRYPYALTEDWDRGYRSQRIRELLEAEQDVTIQEMLEIQNDAHNPLAETLVPYLLEVHDVGSQYYRDGVDLLARWDYQDDPDSAAAAYFNAVWSNLLRLAFHDDLRQRIWPTGGQRWFAVVEQLLPYPAHDLWDDRGTEDVREVRDDILRQAIRDARDELTRRQSVRAEEWTWGRLHRLNLRNQTLGSSGIGALEWLLNRDGYQVGGGSSVVNATAWDASLGYEVTAAPSMRMVVSLADFDDSRWINLTGVSGHPASSHYVDQTELFVEGETLPWAFGAEAVRAAAEDTLVFTPGQ